MKKRHQAIIVGLAAALSGIALVPAAGAGGPQPAAPAQAQALIGAPALVASGSVTRAVSAQEAMAAASLPGASISAAAGLSLTQAVGLSPVVSTSTSAASIGRPLGVTTAAIGCSANDQWYEWGTWPYQQRIDDTTYWCAVYADHITFTSSTTSGSGTICSVGSTGSQTVSGGIGYSWFVNRASAQFTCPTAIPWVALHPSRWEDTSRNAWGNTALVGNS
jgi:hypothetical protein